MEISNAKIAGTFLGKEYGVPVCGLELQFEGSKVWHRYGRNDYSKICDITDTVEVPSWEHLRGKFIRVKKDGDIIKAIGNIVEDKWCEL